MGHDVFISYSSEDKSVADAVCANLENKKIRCWIAPRDIPPGEEWGKTIVDAINQSKILVLVFSDNANESPQVLREVERAVNRAIPIIPLRIEDVLPHDSMEYYISATHWLDAITPPIEEHIEKLSKIVQNILYPPEEGKKSSDDYAEIYLPKKEKKSRIRNTLGYLSILFGILVVLSCIVGFFVNTNLDNFDKAALRISMLLLGSILIIIGLFPNYLANNLGKLGPFINQRKSLIKSSITILIIILWVLYVATPFTYNQNGLYLEVGSNWDVATNTNGALVSFSATTDTLNSNFLNTMEIYKKEGNLKDEFDKQLTEYAKNPNLQLITNSTFGSGDNIGYTVEYKDTSRSNPSYLQEAWMVRNNSIYVLRMISDVNSSNLESNTPQDFVRARNSFKIN